MIRSPLRIPGSAGAALVAVPLALALVVVGACPCRARPSLPSGDGDAAVDLLKRARQAARITAYHGVEVISSWSGGPASSETVKVSNIPGRGTFADLDHSGYAQGSVVRTVPTARAFGHGRLSLLTANYKLVRNGSGRVAGRAADIVEARQPSRGSPVAARYWLDKKSGVLLRRDVLTRAGSLARQSLFLDIAFEAPRPPNRQASSVSSTAGGGTASTSTRSALRGDGWTLPRTLPGDLVLHDVRITGRGSSRVVQLSYSDGISAVSVFEQRGRLDRSSLDGWRKDQVAGRSVYLRDAVPRQLTWASSGTVYTVVADAPDATVGKVVGALPARTDGPGLWGRLWRGLGRIGSWCNPFG
ncbi:MAG: sigma-E factor regulatory protein RseB domain-containing protein [Streptosporangiales bacterium]